MDDVFVYLREDMPCGVSEMVTPCPDGYTVYINASLDQEHRMRAYEHALSHIKNNDFEKNDVQEIESSAHGLEPTDRIPVLHLDEKIKELQKRQRKLKWKINKNQEKVRFLQKYGYDFFSAAENRYLNP